MGVAVEVLMRRTSYRTGAWAAEFGAKSWSQFFLKYVVSHPAVTVAIPGMTRIEHLNDNLDAIRGRMPDAAMRARMEKFWDQNFES